MPGLSKSAWHRHAGVPGKCETRILFVKMPAARRYSFVPVCLGALRPDDDPLALGKKKLFVNKV